MASKFSHDESSYATQFHQEYPDEMNSFIQMPSKTYSSLLSTIFSNDICNDLIMHVHIESEKIKHRLQEKYCQRKYNISEVIISGSGGEQWMPYGDSDIDQMYIEHGLVDENETTSCMYFTYTQYPSYVLLHRGQRIIQHVDVLKHKKYRENFEQFKLYEHGPAWCIKTPIWPNDDQSVVKQMETDIVPCYQLRKWPTIATEYIHRKTRQHAWPPIELIHKCLNNEISCLLTPVGYKLSNKRNHQWRISFSVIEMELVKTLTKNQRLCYVLFKSICKEHVIDETNMELEQANNNQQSIQAPFGSYILKNIFFHWCESNDGRCCSPETILDCVKQLFEQLYKCLAKKHCPHYIITCNNLLSTVVDDNDAVLGRYLAKIRRILDDADDKGLKYMIAHQPMFLVFYECFFKQYSLWHRATEELAVYQKLSDFYTENIDRDTVIIPLTQIYDCIFTRLAQVFDPVNGLGFEQLLTMLNDLHRKYIREEETGENRKGKCYINFSSIMKRCIGNLHLQNVFFLNTNFENDTDDETEKKIESLSFLALEEVRYQYLESHPLFNTTIDHTDSYNDIFSGAAMIAYLRYCSKHYIEVASYTLRLLVDNEDKLLSNFIRNTTAVQIPISTYYCNNLILEFLTEQSTTRKDPVDDTFDPRACSVIFISPFPLIIHVYVLSMIELDFIPRLISSDFTMNTCLSLLSRCYEYDSVPLNQFLYEKTKNAYENYAKQRQLREAGNWNPYSDDDDTDTEKEEEHEELEDKNVQYEKNI